MMATAFGIDLGDLPPGSQPIECVALVKVLTEDGKICLCERASKGLTSWEALGMVTTFADTLRAQLQEGFEAADDGDD